MTDSFNWQGLNDFIKQDPDISGRIYVTTDELKDEGTYTVTVQNVVTIMYEDGSSQIFSPNGLDDRVEVTFQILNPCRDATLVIPELSLLSFDDGQTSFIEF